MQLKKMASRFIVHALVVSFCWLFFTQFVSIASRQTSDFAGITIETESGDLYDFIDFYKQPAFNHPLLKSHSFYPEMRPSWRPKTHNKMSTNRSDMISMDHIKLKNGGCPRGTVPIRRMSKDDELYQTQMLQQHYSTIGKSSVIDATQSNTYFAVAQSRGDPRKVYYGLGAVLSVFQPEVSPPEYSSGQITLRSGTDAIVVGWTVNPNVYRDKKTRFFIYTLAKQKHCFNSQCGFVSVRQDIPLDFVMSPVSTLGEKIYVTQFFVYQDEKNGNWWLEVGADSTVLGFWPQKIFRGLYKSATYISCGGEAFGPSNMDHPQMGTGYYPFSHIKEYNSYCQNIIVVNEAHDVVYTNDMDAYSNNEHNYGVQFVQDRMAIYGGPNVY